MVWSPTCATASDPVKSLVPCGTRYSSMPIPRIPTTTPSMIRTPIFFSRRASHTSDNPPAQRYLDIPPLRKADSRRTRGKARHYRGAEHIHSISNLVGRRTQSKCEQWRASYRLGAVRLKVDLAENPIEILRHPPGLGRSRSYLCGPYSLL